MDESRFGAAVNQGGLPPRDEERVLRLYATYVVSFPRVRGKDYNTAAYAECSLSAIRDRAYERFGRIPGGQPTECRFRERS